MEEEAFGARRSVELLPGGADTPVTNANRLLYVHLAADWHLNGRLGAAASAFAGGLHQARAARKGIALVRSGLKLGTIECGPQQAIVMIPYTVVQVIWVAWLWPFSPKRGECCLHTLSPNPTPWRRSSRRPGCACSARTR